jgi:hypothetical protein
VKQETKYIECPNCGSSIDLNASTREQLESELRMHFQQECLAEKEKLQEKTHALDAEREQLKEIIDQEVDSKLKVRFKEETAKPKKLLRLELEEESEEAI